MTKVKGYEMVILNGEIVGVLTKNALFVCM